MVGWNTVRASSFSEELFLHVADGYDIGIANCRNVDGTTSTSSRRLAMDMNLLEFLTTGTRILLWNLKALDTRKRKIWVCGILMGHCGFSNNSDTFTGNASRWLAVQQNTRTKYVRFTAWKRDEFGDKMEEMSPWKQWRAEPYKTEEERAADTPPLPKGYSKLNLQ